MSKKTRIISFRLPANDEEAMESTISSRNAFMPRRPWTQTEFILLAIREKVAKMARSRNKGRKLTLADRPTEAEEENPPD